jgi:hypothetical protein
MEMNTGQTVDENQYNRPAVGTQHLSWQNGN